MFFTRLFLGVCNAEEIRPLMRLEELNCCVGKVGGSIAIIEDSAGGIGI